MAVADNIYISTGADMVSVANKIRDKAGISDGLIFPDGWIEAIEGIKTGSGGITPSGNKTITATTSIQTGIDVKNYATVSVAPTPSETKSVTTNGDVTPSSGKLLSKVTVNVPTGTARDSSDLTVSGPTVNVPAGLYSSAASKSVASGTAGTPTASKGAVSNNSVTVTPSVTNTEGYIAGGTKTGTGVKVSASELVSGNKAITPSETAQSGIDVTNFKTASVSAISSTYVGSDITRKAAATIIPTESEQVISAGQYLEGDQTISAIPSNYIGSGIATKGSTTIAPSTSIQTAVSAGTYVTGDIKVSAMTNGELNAPTVNASGLVTSSVKTSGYLDTSKTSTLQLTTKGATTITPSTSVQTAVVSGTYITGDIKVAAMPTGLWSIGWADKSYVRARVTQAGYFTLGRSIDLEISTKDAQTYTPGTVNQYIDENYYLTGRQTIKGDANLIPENIASGVSIFGVTGTHKSSSGIDTSDATATADNIENGKTAYAKGEKVTGNLLVADNFTMDKSAAKVAWDNGDLKITGTSASKCILRSFATINIPVSGDKFGNATADNVVSGATFTSTAGLKVTGTMVVQKYYTGNTAPSNSLGNDGDLYLQA